MIADDHFAPDPGRADGAPDPSGDPASPSEATILSYNVSPEPAAPAGLTPAQFAARLHPQIPSDLRVPWGWTDLFLLVVIWFGASVLTTVLLAILLAAEGIPWHEIQHSPRVFGLFAVGDQLVVWTIILAYLAVQMRVRFDAPFWRTLSWRGFDTAPRRRTPFALALIASGFLLSALVQLASSLFPASGKLPIENVMDNRQAALLLMVMSVLLAPFVEETVFRGYIYPVVGRTFGVFTGVVATGTVFGLLHAEQLWGGWFQIALLVVVGIVFTWVRASTRTVFASFLLHISYNSYILLGFLLSANGFRSLPH